MGRVVGAKPSWENRLHPGDVDAAVSDDNRNTDQVQLSIIQVARRLTPTPTHTHGLHTGCNSQ